MPTDFKLDASGDIDLTSRKIELIPIEQEATRQRLQIALRHIQGDWFLDINAGLPYLTTPFTDKNNKTAVDNFFKAAILAVPGVKRISKFKSDISERVYTLDFSAVGEGDELIPVRGLEI